MKPVIRCLILLLLGGCALAFSWGFGSETFWRRHASGNVPAPTSETATDPRGETVRIVEGTLLKLGFEDNKSGDLVIPLISLNKLCAVLHCQPRDFQRKPGAPAGVPPPTGDFCAPGGFHLYRRHFYCHIWTFDDEQPSNDSLVQVSVFLSQNGYPDCPE